MSIPNDDWKQQGACRDHHPELWFSEPGSVDGTKALEICAPCPVRQQCLQHALAAPEQDGIWGGWTEKDRDRARRKRTRTQPRKSRRGKYTELSADEVVDVLARLDAGTPLPQVQTETGIGREVCRRVWREHRDTPNPPRRAMNQQAIARRAGQSRYSRVHSGNRPSVPGRPNYATST